VLRAKDDLSGALRAFEEAIQSAPSHSVALAGKAHVLEELGRYDEARLVYAGGVEKFPRDESLAAGEARILRRQGRYPEALGALDRLVQQFPFAKWAEWARADVLRRLGHNLQALEALELILSERPDFSLAKTSKASLLISEGRLDEADAVLGDQEPKAAHEWARFVLRAAILNKRGDWTGATALLAEGSRRTPFARERRFIRSALAALNLEKGNAREAAKIAEFRPGGNYECDLSSRRRGRQQAESRTGGF
jgi:tetratricopeptide (TPR) repeat protein